MRPAIRVVPTRYVEIGQNFWWEVHVVQDLFGTKNKVRIGVPNAEAAHKTALLLATSMMSSEQDVDFVMGYVDEVIV